MNRYNFVVLLAVLATLIYGVVEFPRLKRVVHRVLASLAAIRLNIDAIARVLGAQRPASFTVTRVVFFDERILIEGDIRMIRLSDTQKTRVTFGKPLDGKGFPAEVQADSVKIEATDDSITVTPVDGDQFSVDVVANHPTTDITAPGGVKISADADLGDGVSTIEGFEPVLVTGGAAKGFGAPTATEPTEQ
jgi:hypothetical protein